MCLPYLLIVHLHSVSSLPLSQARGHSLGTPTAFSPILTLFYSKKFVPSQLFYSISVGHSLKNAIFLCYAFFGLELRPHLISPSATQQRSVNELVDPNFSADFGADCTQKNLRSAQFTSNLLYMYRPSALFALIYSIYGCR
jgi:hypothetical protein